MRTRVEESEKMRAVCEREKGTELENVRVLVIVVSVCASVFYSNPVPLSSAL